MFTPQRKVWPGWSLSPKSATQVNGSGAKVINDGGKGKGVVNTVGSEPATPLLGANGVAFDSDDLKDKVTQLEKELYEYQYNLGLLLIEKKEWNAKHEELRYTLAEAKDTLKREQTAHLIAISEIEKHEDDLRNALGIEKQCVIDLEKSLRDMRAEYAEIKFTADSKLAEANALVSSVDEKALEVDAKLRAADAKLAEISRKTTEIERKKNDLEAREATLRRERLLLISERESHDSIFSKQREDLLEWERKLKEGEERVADRLRILNQREEMANDKDRAYKQKLKEVEDQQRTIDEANSALREKEDDIKSRLSMLELKEKENEFLKKKLETKEEELTALEEKLNARERDEIQKLLEEHDRVLEVKKKELEHEHEEKRKALEEDLERRGIDVQKKEAELSHREEKFLKREQALEKKSDKLKEREEDLQLKLKDLKEQEKSHKSEDKNLQAERKQVLAETKKLLSFKAILEKERDDCEVQLLKIRAENDQLKVTEEERGEFVRLQTELKEEIEKCRLQKELLLKESDELRNQRQTFEKEWEALDEKKIDVEKKLKEIIIQRERYEKFKECEEERLQRDKMAAEEDIKRQREDVRLAKDSFLASMEHEKKVVAQKLEDERSEMLRSFELQKKELEIEMQRKLEERENNLLERVKTFEEEKETELSNINYLREVARRDMEELKQERSAMEKEREEFLANKKHLEEQQVEIRKDIDQLSALSRKLKEQRESFFKERDRFVSFVKKQSGCVSCGELTREFMLSDLEILPEIEPVELPCSKLIEEYAEKEIVGNENSSDRQNVDASPNLTGSKSPFSSISWIRKCTSKIFSLSPGKRSDDHPVQDLDEREDVAGEQGVTCEPSKSSPDNDAEFSFAVASGSGDVDRLHGSDDAGQGISFDNSKFQDDSLPSDVRTGRGRPQKRGKAKVRRTRTMKQVVKDAEAILGTGAKQNDAEWPNGIAEDSVFTNPESRGDSSLVEKGRPRNARKRNHAQSSEQLADDTQSHSESIVPDQRKKRRQRAVAQVESRYNLRRRGGNDSVPSVVNEGKNSNPGGGDTGDKVNHAEVTPARSAVLPSENGEIAALNPCSNVDDKTEGSIEGSGEANQDVSEEVNGTPERAAENSEEEDGDEEFEHPGETSIGRKFLKFLVT
ncbi:hypothetical protein MLD38_000254 [Melastoma candidum]|uniref:Uncharacterized protein n=1 Tax=Melastoma candidum TaxID=119954 RepID=A0ACB9SB29_9MYRT|nr:hypothetical protein MLD38_000254 [Melastoma candidum]